MLEAIQRVIDDIEAHLTEEIDVHDVAARAYISTFHFQRVFSAACGLPFGEYIRRRRLTLAAQELTGGCRVIDAATKYGYDSPDSFARAFRRFHGILPSQACQPGVTLASFAPMKISLKEGGTMMEYKIVEKPAFTVVGYMKQFNNETSYQEIPKWWTEKMARKPAVMGQFGVCIDSDGKLFNYMIADLCQPWKAVPEDCVTYTLPAGTWAVFPCTLGTLQETNTKMWRDWLPSCREYKLGGNYNLEFYYELNEADPSASGVELWLPVQRAE
nr:AraC family transcriptional regulator [Clostridia bacterium]